MLDVDWKGFILPVSYLLVLYGTFVTFSSVYRKRKAGAQYPFPRAYTAANLSVAESANLAPWFPPHLQRNVYHSILHLEGEEGEKKPKVPESVVRAALLRRAVEDIHRIVAIKSGKQACSVLLQRGSIGDDLWQRYQRAEKEMEEELRDVVMEVSFRPTAASCEAVTNTSPG
jgi:translocation protein SEC66